MKRGLRGLTRRGVLAAGGAALAAPLFPPLAWAAGRTGLHGLSIFGELKYPPISSISTMSTRPRRRAGG